MNCNVILLQKTRCLCAVVKHQPAGRGMVVGFGSAHKSDCKCHLKGQRVSKCVRERRIFIGIMQARRKVYSPEHSRHPSHCCNQVHLSGHALP